MVISFYQNIWQHLARWPIKKQWMMITLFSCIVFGLACCLMLYPSWRQYRQTIGTLSRLSVHSKENKSSILTDTQQNSTISSNGIIHVTKLLQIIAQLTVKHNLCLAQLKHLSPTTRDASLQKLHVEWLGDYQNLISLISNLIVEVNMLCIQEVILEKTRNEEKIRLSAFLELHGN